MKIPFEVPPSNFWYYKWERLGKSGPATLCTRPFCELHLPPNPFFEYSHLCMSDRHCCADMTTVSWFIIVAITYQPALISDLQLRLYAELFISIKACFFPTCSVCMEDEWRFNYTYRRSKRAAFCRTRADSAGFTLPNSAKLSLHGNAEKSS